MLRWMNKHEEGGIPTQGTKVNLRHQSEEQRFYENFLKIYITEI